VIMPSHIHLIARSSVDEKLSNFIRDFKSFSAKRIINEIGSESFESRKEWLLYMFRFFANGNARNKEFQFWQQTNHPTMLYSNVVIEQKMNTSLKTQLMQALLPRLNIIDIAALILIAM
jgi:putative transposase